MKATTAILWLAMAPLAIASGCTTEQAYNSAQAWQRNECNKIVDSIERERCLERTNTGYGDYKRQTESAKP